MPSVVRIVDDAVVDEMVADMSRKWKAFRGKKESLMKAFQFVRSEEFKTLPVEVRVLVLKGAFYVNRTLPSSSGGDSLE